MTDVSPAANLPNDLHHHEDQVDDQTSTNPTPSEQQRGTPTPGTSNSSSSSTGRTTNSSSQRTPTRLCTYFAQGNCRHGKDCRFSHDNSLLQQQQHHHNHHNQQHGNYNHNNSSSSPRRNNYQQHQQPFQNHHNQHQHHQQNHQYYNNSNTTSPSNANPFPLQPPHSPYAHAPILVNNGHGAQPPSPPSQTSPRRPPSYQNSFNAAVPTSVPPPPMFVNIPPNQSVYCIDVECVATGVQHNARAVAQVAMVDQWSRVVYNAYIKQDVPVVSYLTEIHGITEPLLQEKGIPLADALAELRSHLSPNAILVGQSIHKDIHWLQLVPGIDFHSFINLSDLFRVWNHEHGAYTNFSLDHCAKAWLGVDRKSHEAVDDAVVTMSLFNAYRHVQWFPMQLMELQQRTLTSPRIPGFSSLHPVIDGCCMGNRKKCVCGAPFE